MVIVLKPRALVDEMTALRSLKSRMTLVQDDSKRYTNLEKGLAGEQRFDRLAENLQKDMYIINGLCLEHHHSIIQIDSLLISETDIFLLEIKNYGGDYIYNSEAFRAVHSKMEILNPLHQLNRSVTLLRYLLKKLKNPLPVTGFLAFVNPQFTLYETPVDVPVILPSQLNRFLNKIDQTPSILNRQHKELADRLCELHLPNSPYTRMPPYNYEHLQKGVLCHACYSFMLKKARKLYCTKCKYEESLERSIMRSAEEFAILFPEQQITTSAIFQWCQVIESRKPIRRVLAQNFTSFGSKKNRYYVISK